MELKKRKPIRLKDFDYSQDGVYFITICTEGRRNILSTIDINQDLETAKTKLTPIGVIVEQELLRLPEKYPNMNIDTYIIMPNHIHVLISVINEEKSGSLLQDMVKTYKSITTKICREKFAIQKVFQRSFYDHIIRSEKDYNNTFSYIQTNPGKWIYDKYYAD